MSAVPLFRRSAPAAANSHPVFEFWDWWRREGRNIDPHGPSPLLSQLDKRVKAIDPELTWHFSAGSESEYRLTVTGDGDPERRPAATRWLRAAPAADPTWEFRSSQEADPSALVAKLEIAGAHIDLSQTMFGLDPDLNRKRVHVAVYHPSFANLPGGRTYRCRFYYWTGF